MRRFGGCGVHSGLLQPAGEAEPGGIRSLAPSRVTSASLHKEPLLVEAGGAGLEQGRQYAVIGVLARLDALLAQNVVQASVLKTRRRNINVALKGALHPYSIEHQTVTSTHVHSLPL